jgi:ribosomal protein S18 acetylase RimI-like enzyme
MEPTTRLLTLTDVDRAAYVISDAFMDDPLVSYMLPGRGGRKKALLAFFRAYGQVSIQSGRGYGVGEPLHGVAYWKTPDQAEISIPLSALKNFIPLLFTSYPISYIKKKVIFRQIDDLHARYAPEPHFYLDNIGVLESARGQGAASSLIRPVLERADTAGAIAYTDTVNEANVPLYKHFGFQVMEACKTEDGSLTIWALRREAR